GLSELWYARGANSSLDDIEWIQRRWRGAEAYAESKLHDVLLALPWLGDGPTFYPTRWSPAGCRPRWAALAPRTIWTRPIELRCGLPAAMIPRSWGRDGISIPSVSGQPIPPCTTQRNRISCSTSANGSQ